MIFEFLEYDFMVRALFVGGLCALTSSVIGNFLVASRNAVFSEMISHVALAGVVLGILLGISPNFTAIVFSLVVSTLLYVFTRKRQFNEAIAMFFLSGGIALSLLFVHLSEHYQNTPIFIDSFLFGSILTVTEEEMNFFSFFVLVIFIFFFIFWRRFLALVFIPNLVRKQVVFFEILFIFLVGILVTLSLKVIGGLLIGALLVIPVLTAQNFANSFKQSVGWTMIFNLLGVITGILSSYYWNIPTSSAIVLVLIMFFLLVSGGRNLVKFFYQTP